MDFNTFEAAVRSVVPVTSERKIPLMIAELRTYWGKPEIPNATFKEMKDRINALVEASMKGYIDVVRTLCPVHNSEAWKECMWTVNDSGFVMLHQVVGKLKKLKTLKLKFVESEQYREWVQSRLELWAPVAVEMERLKGCCVKRQPKAAEDKVEKYIAPMVSKASGKVMYETLVELTNRMYTDYMRALFQSFVETVEFVNHLSARERREMAFRHKVSEAYGYAVWEGDFAARTLKSNYREILQKEAEKVTKEMQDAFVVKNAQKMGVILDKKTVEMQKPEIISAKTISSGVFEGVIRVTFADGSQFTVKNQVVYKRSNRGVWFAQYPTTFHNVKLPNGTMMSQPSEERMNTVFAVA